MNPWTPDLLAPEDRVLWEAMGAAAPRYSPMPTPGARHELAACRVVARMLGTPLLPWQEWMARLATERSSSDFRRYRFPTFLITVPRQAGKTTIVRVILLTRAILYLERQAFYTAQTGKDASARWQDLCKAVKRRNCPMAPEAITTLRRAAGSAALTVVPTGSTISPFAPTPESLHGYTPHDVATDELFAFSDVEGNDLEGAIVPAQLTLPDKQFLQLSTAGNRDSTYLKRKVEAGRAAISAGDVTMGYVEHSMTPGADPYDPATWDFHPAYGHTQHREDFEAAAFGPQALPPGEWLRAMMNVWTEDTDPLFDMRAYDACRVPALESVPLADVVVGVGISTDRDATAAVAAWPLERDGAPPAVAVKLLTNPLTAPDLTRYLTELAQRPDAPPIYGMAGSQQTRTALDEVRRGVSIPGALAAPDGGVTALDSREWSIASAQLHAAITERTLSWTTDEGSSALRSGVDRAVSRQGTEGAWFISPTSPPEVLALAAALRGVRVKVDTPAVILRF